MARGPKAPAETRPVPRARAVRRAGASRPERKKTVLVLSAGAPHSPLMAGALCAAYEQGKTFDIIYTSGAGALIGLLFVAPKGKTPDQALRGLVDLGVSDAIYRWLPIGYKAFCKPGLLTMPIHRWAQRFKLGNFPLGPLPQPVTPLGHAYNAAMQSLMTWQGGAVKRFYNDLVDLWATILTPTTLTPWSKGLCPPLPFLEDLVDFHKLRAFPGHFFVNAFSPTHALEGRAEDLTSERARSGIKAVLFDKHEITLDHVRAAFAYPFIYEPVWIDHHLYFEGADRDPINFGNLLTHRSVARDEIKTVVLIDILGSLDRHLLRAPRSLWDAFGLSIMAPVVAHAKKEISRFETAHRAAVLHQRAPGGDEVPPFEYHKLTFDIPDNLGEHLTEWSYSNLSSMFEIGHKRGQRFWEEIGDSLPNAPR